MNEASRWRLSRAREVAPIYTADPRVRAVIVGGSVARGWADEWSDVEIGVFWDQFPTPAEFQALMERARGTLWELDPYTASDDVWYEEYAVDGLKIDLRHMTVGRMSEVLSGMIDGGDDCEERQTILAAVQSGIVLHGEPLVAGWRERAARYPEALARRMVSKHLDFEAWWVVTMYAERGELPLVYHAFAKTTQHIFGVLMGLNRIYTPRIKWLDQKLAMLPIAPQEIGPRIRRAYREEPVAGAETMRQLVEEVFALVDQQMPDLDITAARRNFRYARPRVGAAP